MFKLKIHRVVGQSMSPTLADNDYVVCGLWPGFNPINGCLVVVAHPQLQVIVKRVIAVDTNGRMLLAGDHDASTSTSKMGWVEQRHLIGRVMFHISP